LTEVIGDCLQRAVGHVILDGTLVPTDRVAARTETGNDLWYSGKHHTHGGNVQILSDPAGNPLWTSEVRPGSVHDLTCARELALPALYPHAHDLPTLAEKGYIGAGIGIHTPIRRPAGGAQLCPDTRTYNTLINATRALGERAIAQLKTRWRALHHVTLDPTAVSKSACEPISAGRACVGAMSGDAEEVERSGEGVVGHVADGGGDVAEAGLPEQVDRQAADGGHVLGAVAGPDLGCVLTERHVPDVVQPILDEPLRSGQSRQPFRGRLR
jgi:hypothetical protein